RFPWEDQTWGGDADPCAVRQPLADLGTMGGENLAAVRSELGQHFGDRTAVLRAAYLDQLTVFGRPPYCVCNCGPERHRLEHALRRRLLRHIEAPENLLGMIIELLFQAAIVGKF